MLRPLLALPLAALLATGCTSPDTAETAAPETAAPETAAPEAAEATTDAAPAGDAVGAANQALAVGDRAPDFALPAASGGTVRLSEQLARGPVVLTFYRGAWCPYCNTQLRDYQENIAAFEAEGARLLAVSPQTPDSSAVTESENALAFPVLSDLGNVVSRDYGLVFRVDEATRERYRAVGVDLARYNGTDDCELPVPATYVIGVDGVVEAAFVEADYTQRASVRQILDALAGV